MPHTDTGATYSERYVAFVDVLGFRSIIERSSSDVTVVRDVWSAMNGISQRALESRAAGVEATSFSDNIVLSAPVSAPGLAVLFETIEAFSTDLLKKNMLFRGAVARDLLVHDSNVVFGPGLVRAYLMETSVAFHPRVILHDAVYNDCARYREEGDTRCWRFISTSSHDVPYLNPFARWASEPELNDTSVATLVQLLGIIAEGLAGTASQPAVAEKYKWLARRFDAFVRSRNLTGRIGIIDPDT